jgi:hypothetical protein
VPVGEADEQHGVDRVGDVGVADQIPSRRSLPRARSQPASLCSVSVSSMMTVSMNRCLPARNSWPPDFDAVMAAAAMSLATWRTVSARRSS